MKSFLLIALCCIFFSVNNAQLMVPKAHFSRYDTLRGSITAGRIGWNVLQYDITMQPDILQKTIIGKTIITYYESMAVHTMQIDLQQPLIVDSITAGSQRYKFNRDSNICFVYLRDSLAKYKIAPGTRKLTVYYHGQPVEAKKAPWDGGLVWTTDSLGRPWVGTACQGLGASVWWPCKDYQGDEPDSGITMHIIVPDTLVAVSNGRLQSILPQAKGYKMWNWKVINPINTYDVTMDIGRYVKWNDTLMGENGKLDLQYWVLDYNLQSAKRQFAQVKPMLHSHEYWFGKYPFYEDGYKLIETPFLGMEHQSGVAYGNKYINGYLGRDLSGTGWGLKWDYIIVHESGHEWFGNSITSKDIADMWLHEGFTCYSETLYTDYIYGKSAGQQYCHGLASRILNDEPVIGPYGVNKEGSGDMYRKGATLLNMIRITINDDGKFRKILRGLNHDFYHQTVTTQQVEKYISDSSRINFSTIFDQYLRTTKVPELQYYYDKNEMTLMYRWGNCVKGFNLPVVLSLHGNAFFLSPADHWQTMTFKNDFDTNVFLSLNEKYYAVARELSDKPNL